MGAPFTEIEMMILSQLAYKDPPASSYNNGNAQISLAEYIESNYSYLSEELGKDAQGALKTLHDKVSKDPGKYTIVKACTDKYTTGFSAFAVQGPDKDTVTVAARGTEFGKFEEGDPGSAARDLLTDAQLGYSSETDQQNAMDTFMGGLEKYDSIYLTGHSLGGNLAVSGAVGFDDPNKIKGVYTYNAPGQNSGYFLTHRKGIDDVKDKVVNYQNEGDMISDINAPVGKVILVKSDSGDSIDLSNSFKNHGLKDMDISNGTFVTTNAKSRVHRIGAKIIFEGTTVLSSHSIVMGVGLMFLADEVGTVINKVGDWFREKAESAKEWAEDKYKQISRGEGSNTNMGKKGGGVIESGTINTEKIYATHRQIKEIVESYKEVNLEVSKITNKINDNWVGEGRDAFQSQYNLLIKKIDDFGDTLQEIYEALVEAEAEYETSDDALRQEFVKAIES